MCIGNDFSSLQITQNEWASFNSKSDQTPVYLYPK